MLERTNNERGVALAVAIFALVVIGALVGGAFYLGMQEQAIGRNTLQSQQAFTAADGGAQFTLANWDGSSNTLADGDSVVIGGWLQDSLGWYRGSIMRLNEQLFLIRSEGFSRDSMSRQQVGALVRLSPVEVVMQSALTTQGATKIGGSSFIDGNDHVPGGWSGCDTTAALPGLITTDSSEIQLNGCGGYSCLAGDPKIEIDTTLNDSTLTTFGDVDFSGFAAMATKTLPDGTYNGLGPVFLADGSCDRSNVNNWGDPMNPSSACGSYYPIIYAPNGLKITGGVGQGILLVNGDLEIQGGAEFFGPVIVTGVLKTAGTGGHFNGGVIAANVELDQNTILGNAVVSYSSCAVERALAASAPVIQMRERSWVSLN